MADLKVGSKGQEVRSIQEGLVKLGYNVDVDGDFGQKTEQAVRQLQQVFGYDVDGVVGKATYALITQQVGYGWNAQAPDAAERAKKAQIGNA